MRILIACEYSGVIRDIFRALGHDAMSCDILPTEAPGPHYEGDVRDVLHDGWDMMIAHPECTYLCSSGLHWNKRVPGRAQKTEEALDFVRLLMGSGIPRIAIENPVGCISTRIDAREYGFRTQKATQYVQPYEYGDDASKRTGLWLKGLPDLIPSNRLPGRLVEWPKGSGKLVERWSNQTDSGQNVLGPSAERGKDRAKSYMGIALAMGERWG